MDKRSERAWKAALMSIMLTATVLEPAMATAQPVSAELSVVVDGTDQGYFCDTDASRESVATHEARQVGQITPQLTNHGGDMAFWGDTLVIACGGDDANLYNDGFVILDISDPTAPRKIGDFACVASASDIAIWGDLVFLAVDRNSDTAVQRGPAGTECDAPVIQRGDTIAAVPGAGFMAPVDEAQPVLTFQGVRVVDISNPGAPEQIAAIRTGRHGAHNITVVPELDATDGTPEQRVLVYAASPHNSQKRDPLTGAADPGDYNEVIAVPLDAPSTSEVVARIKVGDSGGCHDISFFMPRGIAACNRGAAGTALWDVRDDPEEPRDDGASLLDPKVIAYMLVEAPPTIVEAPRTGPTTMHSSAFSWDGDTLVVSDENFFEATLSGTCRSQAPPYAGSIFFYDVSPDALRWLWTAPARGTRADLPEWGVAKRVPPTGYHLPPPVENNGNCSSKQVSVIPLASGRDVAVISWMGGGTSVIDFTRPDAPMQLAYFAPLPGTNDRTAAWASYWYNGSIFVNNAYGCWLQICTGTLTRGLDVLRLDGHDLGDTIPMPSFNFGLQECLTVPSGAAHQGLGDCP